MSETERCNPEANESRTYPQPSVTVDIVVFSLVQEEEDLRVLLVQRGQPPFEGMWALPGGFIRIDESLDDAAARELAEETGVAPAYMEQLYTFGAPQRDPRHRVITVAYFAIIPMQDVARQQDSDAADAAWYSLRELPPLAFDHAAIVDYALTRLRYKLEYTSVGFELLPNEFTLTELQRAYEVVLDVALDKRNFRRKILAAEILAPTGSKRREASGRPAKLYRYRDDAVAEVKTRRLFP